MMIACKVWLALITVSVAVSVLSAENTVTIKHFRAKQVGSSAHVMLTWTPSSQPSNLQYTLDYHFLGKDLKKTISNYKEISLDVLLIAKSCRTASFKLTPIVGGKPGSSVELSFTFPQVPTKVVNLRHKTSTHNNKELIFWSIDPLVKDCELRFEVDILFSQRPVIVTQNHFVTTKLRPGIQYTAKVRHVDVNEKKGPTRSISFIAKHGGTEPSIVYYESKVSPGKVNIQIGDIRYEKYTPIAYFLVQYNSGIRQTNVTLKIKEKAFSITSYDACSDLFLSISQVTKDGYLSKPRKSIIKTLPHVPEAPVLECKYVSHSIELTWITKHIQGNWRCDRKYLIEVTLPDGTIKRELNTKKEANVRFKQIGNYTFTVQEIVDRVVKSPKSKPVSCYFGG